MAAEHAPPPGGGAAGEPVPDDADGGTAPGETADDATRPTGRLAAVRAAAVGGAGGATTRGRRLLPSGPALEHAPLLLGLDAAGGEHPQGGDYPDDEELVGRVWGCVCGWRGAVRDVSTRPFHPRVGDGGGLRRQRLARSDRESRNELENHLARPTPAADPADVVSPDRASSLAATSVGDTAPQRPASGRPRGRRRRLTVPRDTPLDIPFLTALRIGDQRADKDDGRDVAPEDRAHEEATVAPEEPTSPDAARSPLQDGSQLAMAPLGLAATEHDGEAGERGSIDLLEAAAARAEAAQNELADAELGLAAAVAAAREEGLSWRIIGRTTGLGHRGAAARWGPPGGRPSL